MGVQVSDGSLGFVSTLDNSDFQAKSLQDIKLIQLRLQLTGDTTGIEKYNQAVKESLDIETRLRADLAKILEEAQIQTDNFKEKIKPTVSGGSKTIFSDSVAEVQAYQDALVGLESGASVVAGLNAQLDELVVKTELLNEQLTAGTISEEEYASAMQTIGNEQIRLVNNIQQVNDAYATNILVQGEGIASIQKTVVAVEEEIGILESLKITLAELKANQITISNPAALAANNKALQETEAEIKRFGNVGKVGFDQYGNSVENVTEKQGKFAASLSRVTNLQNLGSRVVTQFTRQIIGLGVGFISLEIGAKAIQSLIKYIENLDVFTGRLDQAKQNLIAFNEVMASADKGAGNQIASLKELYETATNVNIAFDKRLAAAQQLRESYAAEFANASAVAILNGKLKSSYDELSVSILATAKSQAASAKIGQLEGTILDAQYQKEKIRNANANEIARLRKENVGDNSLFAANDLFGNILESNARAKSALQTQDETIKIATGQQDFLLKSVIVISKTNDALKNANKLLGINLENFNSLLSKSQDKADLENIKNALQIKLDAMAPGDSQIATLHAKLQQVDDLIKNAYSVRPTGSTKNDPARALLASQTKTLQDIDALKGKYSSKEKTRNEQETDDLIATYTKQYNAAVAFNTKLAQFRKEHPNDKSAAANKLQPIDLSSINISELGALQGLAGTQSVDATRLQVDKQKAIFKEYEDFKLQAGTDAANKLFKNELGGYTSYIEYLKSLQPTEAELTSSDPFTKARAAGLQDFLKTALPAAYVAELESNAKHLQQLIIQDQTWQQQRVTLIAKANEDIQQLNAAGFKEQAQQVAANLNEELTQLDIQQFEKQAKYKELFNNIDKLSADSAKTLIHNAELQAAAELTTGQITVEAYKKITAALAGLQQNVSDRLPDELNLVGSQLSSISQEFQGINEGFAGYLQNLGQLVTGLANVSKQSDKLQADMASGASTTGDYTSLIGTAVTGVVSLIGMVTSAAKARKQADLDYYNSVIAFQNDYNQALNEQIRLQYKLQGNVFITNYKEQFVDAAKAFQDANIKYQDALSQLQNGQAIVGKHNAVSGSSIGKGASTGATVGAAIGSVIPAVGTLIGAAAGAIIGGLVGLFAGKKKVDTLAPLLATYPGLIQKATDGTTKFNEALAKSLINSGKVDAATKVLLQTTITFYDDQQAALDQINSALTDLAGNLGTSLENALVTAFENGTDAAKAFGSSVSDVIGNIVQQFLFEDIFGSKFQDLNDKLKATVLAGGSQADIEAQFVQFFKDAAPLVQNFEDGLKAAQQAGATQGLTLFPSQNGGAGSPSSLSGGIQAAITENTASILAGTMNGIQLGVHETNISLGKLTMIAQSTLEAALQIQINTRRTADNTDALPDMLDELKGINSNTEGSLGIDLRAAGFYHF